MEKKTTTLAKSTFSTLVSNWEHSSNIPEKEKQKIQVPRMKCKFLHYFHLFIPNSKLFTFGSTLEQRLSRDANQAQFFFYHRYATLHAPSWKKCFISNFSFFQKLVPLSLRRHLQTLRYQRSSTKSRLKITSSRLL